MRLSRMCVLALFIAASSAGCMSDPPEGDEIDVSDTSATTDDERDALDQLCSVTDNESLTCSEADGDPLPTTNDCHEAHGCAWCVVGDTSCMLCDGWNEPKCFKVLPA